MREIDNCPICDTTCELEYGLEKGAGAKIGNTEKEILYATCKTCKTRWRRKDDPQVTGKLLYEKWECRIPEISLPIPFIGGGINLRPRWCRWTRIKERQLPVSNLGMKSEEMLTRKGKTVEETIALGREELAVYDFSLKRDDEVEGKIVSDEPVDVLFFDEKNFERSCGDKRNEPEDISTGIYEMKIDFKATKKGLWFVVIEHEHKISAKVKVHIYSLHKKSKK